MAIKSIIVEDDAISKISLEKLIGKLDDVDVVETFESGEKALNFLNKDKVDLVFLDVELEDMSGLELMDNLETLPGIIMTTSNTEYALDAFAYDVVDFLLKPITLPKLEQAIHKYNRSVRALQDLANTSRLEEIYLRVDGALVRVPVSEILYFENVGDYVKIITEGKTHVLYGALKSIDQRLRHPRLLKVHRSFIINLGKIKDIQDNSILLENGKLIPVSRAHKNVLLDNLNIL